MWMASPSTASAASLTDSETVGCGWMLAPISHGVDSSSFASAVSEISSVALGPMMKTPSRSPDSSSLMILTKPSVSPRMTDLALPTSGNFPTLTFSPWSLACFSDNPRLATCGRSEEHTSELQSQSNLVCRLLLEKKKKHAPHVRVSTPHSPTYRC